MPGKFFENLVAGLSKTRHNLADGINSVFSSRSKIDDEFYDDLEEILIMADMGAATANRVLEKLKAQVHDQKIKDIGECRELLIRNLEEEMDKVTSPYDLDKGGEVILVTGVNGVGKTTTIGKLCGQFRNAGKKVVLAAADTFRAAAAEQLKVWADKTGAVMVAGSEGADPGAVLFDAISSAKSKNADILICDTAGRLQNKKNLMEELKKLDRIIEREYPGHRRENLIVIDATTGQNALSQVEKFGECMDITGVILTKMDGSAKGGIAIAIQSQFEIPVRYIGVGEGIEDLQKFDSHEFIQALFSE